jgi:hypothetical protein
LRQNYFLAACEPFGTFADTYLPVMPDRRIERITVTWFQVSPPRGVLMPRSVGACAISR